MNRRTPKSQARGRGVRGLLCFSNLWNRRNLRITSGSFAHLDAEGLGPFVRLQRAAAERGRPYRLQAKADHDVDVADLGAAGDQNPRARRPFTLRDGRVAMKGMGEAFVAELRRPDAHARPVVLGDVAQTD